MTEDNIFKKIIFKYDVTDIHIKSYNLPDSISYSRDEIDEDMNFFYEEILANSIEAQKKEGSQDFILTYQGVNFRGASVATIDGDLYTLRTIKPAIQLDDLGILPSLRSALVSRNLNRGGIVLITGLPGSGKTTLCVSTIIKRLEQFSGICYAVEDPPEIVFQGNHGDGICFQTDARRLGGYAKSIKNLLRAYPTRKMSMMLVGEIRDPDTAEQVLMSALDGRLVIATMHAGSITDAIKRFVALSSESIGREVALDMASTNIKIIVNQKIQKSSISQEYMTTNTEVASLILLDKIAQLSSELATQKFQHDKSKI